MKNQLSEKYPRSRIPLKTLVSTAVLAAMSSVLMFLDFSLPFFVGYLKLDFSDVPALIGGLALGPLAGLLIELVKNLIHLLRTNTGGVGELANFLIGVSFVVPASLLYRKLRRAGSGRAAAWAFLLGTASMCVLGGVINYYITTPFFASLYFGGSYEPIFGMAQTVTPDFLEKLSPVFRVDSLLKLILWAVTPFNLFKAVIVSLLTYWLHKYLGRFMKQ